jgi:hypothetical protein
VPRDEALGQDAAHTEDQHLHEQVARAEVVLDGAPQLVHPHHVEDEVEPADVEDRRQEQTPPLPAGGDGVPVEAEELGVEVPHLGEVGHDAAQHDEPQADRADGRRLVRPRLLGLGTLGAAMRLALLGRAGAPREPGPGGQVGDARVPRIRDVGVQQLFGEVHVGLRVDPHAEAAVRLELHGSRDVTANQRIPQELRFAAFFAAGELSHRRSA